MNIQTIYHKKNEIFEEEFYKNEECTEAFDFTNAKNLYIELRDGDITPLYEAYNRLGVRSFTIYTPYISAKYFWNGLCFIGMVKTLDNIAPNLSKYIPEDNAVLFLSEEGYKRHKDCFIENYIDNFFKNLGFLREGRYDTIYSTRPFVYDKDLDFGLQKPHPKTRDVCWGVRQTNKLTIFLYHGTQSELQKANEVAKELKEKYGVEEVNLFALHCFVKKTYYTWKPNDNNFKSLYIDYKNEISFVYNNINKIITTNSTGILKPEDSNERLQVIDGKEIFEEYLKTER